MKNMFKTPQIYIARSVSSWDIMIGIVGLMISCMKGQEIYTKFKEKYNKKETLHSRTPLGEETSTLTMDSEEEDEEWVKAEDMSSITIVHKQDTSQGTVRTLALLASTATRLNML
jgi:hypothetical protein